jgi:diphthine synthase
MTVDPSISLPLTLTINHPLSLTNTGPASKGVGVARIGAADQFICYGTLAELETVDFGGPLHSLCLIGEVDHIEQEMLDGFGITESTPRVDAGAAADAAPLPACD